MVFEFLKQKLGFWTTVMSWREPMWYRVRLNGDGIWRAGFALGLGCLATAVLLVLFAINVDPPPAVFAFLGLTLGLLAFLILFSGSGDSKHIRVCEEGITFKRQKLDPLATFTGHLSFEEVSWPYQAIFRIVIVPGGELAKSFSVLLIEVDNEIEMIGVPSKISADQLAQYFTHKQVQVQFGTSIPRRYIHEFPRSAGAGFAGVGLVACLFAFGFYADKVAANKRAADGPKFARLGLRDIPDINRDPRFSIKPPHSDLPKRSDAASKETAPPPTAPPPQPVMPGARPFAFPGFNPRGSTSNPSDNKNPPPTQVTTNLAPPTNPATLHAHSKVSPQGTANHEPPPNSTLTALVGGTGGFPYQRVVATGKNVVGLKWYLGSWAGTAAVGQLEPLFDDRTVAAGPVQVTLGREGYVIGGLQVSATDLVHAVRIIFVHQQADGSLDKSDFYLSDWIGKPTDEKPVVIGDGKTRVLGVYGRKGAVMNAVGLVLAKPVE